jgi:hypothetical protein
MRHALSDADIFAHNPGGSLLNTKRIADNLIPRIECPIGQQNNSSKQFSCSFLLKPHRTPAQSTVHTGIDKENAGKEIMVHSSMQRQLAPDEGATPKDNVLTDTTPLLTLKTGNQSQREKDDPASNTQVTLKTPSTDLEHSEDGHAMMRDEVDLMQIVERRACILMEETLDAEDFASNLYQEAELQDLTMTPSSSGRQHVAFVCAIPSRPSVNMRDENATIANDMEDADDMNDKTDQAVLDVLTRQVEEGAKKKRAKMVSFNPLALDKEAKKAVAPTGSKPNAGAYSILQSSCVMSNRLQQNLALEPPNKVISTSIEQGKFQEDLKSLVSKPSGLDIVSDEPKVEEIIMLAEGLWADEKSQKYAARNLNNSPVTSTSLNEQLQPGTVRQHHNVQIRQPGAYNSRPGGFTSKKRIFSML